MPLHQRRGMLSVLHDQIGYMNRETYDRYLRLSQANDHIRQQIAGTFRRN